jgi:2-polyprenyl-6-methoxyphenol hydroxylase-like FAD-dependent oxidoreductase
MAYGTGGYVGLVRLEDGRLNVAAAFDTDVMKRAGGPGQAAAGILAEVGWPVPDHLADLPWRGTPPLTRQSPRPAAERVMALGDAAGYVEPFTGEGMAWALASGRAVVPLAERAVRNWRVGYTESWARQARRTAALRQRFCRAVTWVTKRPALARAAVGVLGRAPWLARVVV